MFFKCRELKDLNLEYMNTSNVEDMSYMFGDCNKLTDIYFSDFDTSKVRDMSYMFSGCENLEELDLSSFGTSRVENMENMFYKCKNLRRLDISSFGSNFSVCTLGFSSCINLTEVVVASNCPTFVTDELKEARKDSVKIIFRDKKEDNKVIQGSFGTTSFF